MFQSTINNQQSTISNQQTEEEVCFYGSYETNIQKMEEDLMKHFSYNYSQLHKSLVREKYYQLKTVL